MQQKTVNEGTTVSYKHTKYISDDGGFCNLLHFLS